MGEAEPRMALVTAPTDEQRELLSKTLPTDDGEPVNLFRLMVRHPRLMKRFNVLGGLFMAHTALPPRVREFVILRTALRADCRYEHAQHEVIGAAAGLSAAEIASAGLDVGDPGLPEEFRLLARLTDGLLADVDVDEEVWRELRAGHTDEQILELLLLPGFYRMLAGLINGVRLPLDENLLDGAPASGG